MRDLALWSIGVGIATYFLFDTRFDPTGMLISISVSTIYVTVMWSAQLAAGIGAKRMAPMRSRRDVALRVGLHVVVMIVSFAIATLLLQQLFEYPFLRNRWALAMIAMVAVCVSLIAHGSYYLRQFHERAQAAEQAALTAQVRALRAQINPHFLFNSLNSIAALIREQPADAERLTESLADLFRYSLRSSERPTVTLAEEVASLELYLEIERTRFGERLQTVIDVPAELAATRVPSLLLQPLVENAVKHGVENTSGECRIDVAADLAGNRLRLRVTDTGPGFPTTDLEALCARGVGLANVRDRLRYQFGGDASMEIAGNSVIISLPYPTT